jgi:hypothetical protein
MGRTSAEIAPVSWTGSNDGDQGHSKLDFWPESPKGACNIANFQAARMSKPKTCGKYQAKVFLDVFSLSEN